VAERYAAIKEFIGRHAAELDPTVRTIITGASSISAADAFAGQYRLAALRKLADAQWMRMDVLLLPTAPMHYTVEEVLAEPVELNKRLGLYTNFVNLLDCCAIAVPAGFTAQGLPFGVTLIALAFHDRALAALADRLHRAAACGAGMGRAETPAELPIAQPADERISILVVGAHLSGMPLNHELQALGATLVRAGRTARVYRLYVLPNSVPPKPGLVRDPKFSGPGIEGEVWSLTPEAFGRFVARIPAPLGIGKVTLDDGSVETGFLCEAYAVKDAREITALGSWRRYAAAARG
jgi:allophanate hydrolase